MTCGSLTLHHLPEIQEFGGRPPALVKKIQNILTGRIFANWKENLLTLGTVYSIIKAALSFFSGYWFIAFCEFSLGAFLGILRKEIHDFTNLHLANRNLQKANNEYRLANARHTALLNKFENLIASQDKKFNENNEKYTNNNILFQSGLKTMGAAMTHISKELTRAREQGRAVSQEVLEGAIKEFDTQRHSLTLLNDKIVTAHADHEKLIREVIQSAQDVSGAYLEKMGAATRQLEAINDSISSKSEERDQITKEVAELKVVRKGLQRAVSKLDDAVEKNTASAEAVSNAADKISFLMKFKNSDLQKIGGMFATIGTAYILMRVAKTIFVTASKAA